MVDPVVYTKALLKSLDPEKFCRCSENIRQGAENSPFTNRTVVDVSYIRALLAWSQYDQLHGQYSDSL
jgi:hypothetical protein